MNSIQVFKGSSKKTSVQEAIQEIIAQLNLKNNHPDFAICYASSKFPLDALAKELHEKLPQTKIVGCTTAGEFTDQGHSNDSIVFMGFSHPEIQWEVLMIDNISQAKEVEVKKLAQTFLMNKFNIPDIKTLNPDEFFSMVWIDGLSLSEERIAEYLSDGLEGIQMVGGSAGDDLNFKETKVFFNDRVKSNSAVVAIVKTSLPFHIFKHQHFQKTSRHYVITKADVNKRVVYKLNGFPAAQVYAAALGVERKDLTTDLAFLNPVQVPSNGTDYVRSVQTINEDDSLNFYCAIQEGMVINIGTHSPMVETFKEDILKQEVPSGEALIAFNCILRALEAKQKNCEQDLIDNISTIAPHHIGFDTYGEMLQGMHINQTIVGIVLNTHEKKKAA
jgi:hypothetical protein